MENEKRNGEEGASYDDGLALTGRSVAGDDDVEAPLCLRRRLVAWEGINGLVGENERGL